MERCLSLDEPLDVIGAEPKTLSRQLHFLQFATPRHGVNGLNFEMEYLGNIFCREQPNFLLLRIHGATIS
jgi:hypothetical protein